MQNIGIIKRGDTFAFTVELNDTATGDPLTGKEGNLMCQGRYAPNGKLVLDMAVREAIPGTYEFKTNDTASLSVGVSLYFDIEYTDGDVKVSSETFSATVEGDITYG